MMLIFLGGLLASTSAAGNGALELCRPTLAQKAGGEIQSIAATTMRKVRGGFAIEGRLTIFVGMGPPQPGSASAHHLIREDFDFHCRTSGKTVRQATVKALK